MRHEGGDQLWAGGDYGLEGGLSGLLACLCIIAIGLALRRRRGAAQERAVVAHTAAN